MSRYLFFFLWVAALYADKAAVYLSWYGDPTQTMTVQWISSEDDHEDQIHLGDQVFPGSHHFVEEWIVHEATLTDLKPDTEYTFQIGEDPKEYRFRTAPKELSHPVRFVIGGDADQVKKIFHQMNRTVVAQDPLFAVIGGDIAYSLFSGPVRTERRSLRRWVAFLEDWSDQLQTEEGRLIPLLVVAGNHDITPTNYDLFFQFFAFPEKQLYRAVDFGNYLSLLLLDTGHFSPIEGAQTEWLEGALKARTQVPYRFPVYHIAAYPSHYPFENPTSEQIRTLWSPLFEQFNCKIAFEHHNHTYKKTFPIKAGKIDPSGIVYLGDGAWGVPPRATYNRWYLEKRSAKNNVYLVELTSSNEATIRALDLKGQTLDEFKLP